MAEVETDTALQTAWTRDSPTQIQYLYGEGPYGLGAYGADAEDQSRNSWTRTKQALAALALGFLSLLAPAVARAAASDTYTTSLTLRKPAVGVVDTATPWGTKINANLDILDAAICDKRTGCTITGNLVVTGSMTAVLGSSIATNTTQFNGDGLAASPLELDSSTVTLLGPSIGLTTEVTGTLPVGNGGTGATSLTSNGPLYGNGTSAVQALPQMGNGGLVIGTAGVPSTGTLTGAGQVLVTNGAGTISVNTVGISSGCSAGQYLNTGSWTNGVTTGGSCTSAGIGDSVKSSTESFSGAKTFLSSATVGATTYTSTATTGPGAVTGIGSVLVNGWQIVASTNPSGASTTTIYGLQVEKFYRIRGALVATADMSISLRFNEDTNSVYRAAGFLAIDDDTNDTVGASAQNACSIVTGQQVDVGDFIIFETTFRTHPTDGTIVGGYTQFHFTIADGTKTVNGFNGCKYDGAANLSSVSVVATASTFSGYIYLEQLIAPLP